MTNEAKPELSEDGKAKLRKLFTYFPPNASDIEVSYESLIFSEDMSLSDENACISLLFDHNIDPATKIGSFTNLSDVLVHIFNLEPHDSAQSLQSEDKVNQTPPEAATATSKISNEETVAADMSKVDMQPSSEGAWEASPEDEKILDHPKKVNPLLNLYKGKSRKQKLDDYLIGYGETNGAYLAKRSMDLVEALAVGLPSVLVSGASGLFKKGMKSRDKKREYYYSELRNRMSTSAESLKRIVNHSSASNNIDNIYYLASKYNESKLLCQESILNEKDQKSKKKMELFLSRADKKMAPVMEKVAALCDKESKNEDLSKSIENLKHVLSSILSKIMRKEGPDVPGLEA